MSRERLACLVFIFLLCFGNLLHATVIGDWEQQMDGWERVDANDPNIHTVEYDDTYGVTLNDHSLYFHTERTTREVIRYSLIDNNMIDVFRNNLEVTLDVTRYAADWEFEAGLGSWNNFEVSIQAGQGDPNDVNDPNVWSVDENLDGNTSWHPGDPTGDDPLHAVYDYSLVLGLIDFNNLEYLHIVLETNWGGEAYTAGGHYNVDNVQLQGGGPAYDPTPAHDERGVSPEDTVLLSWTPGVYSELQDVYFGTSPVDVAEATRADDRGVLQSKDQLEGVFNPGPLEYGRTYHWRIDMVNGPNDILKGKVWTFTTPYLGPGIVMGDFEQTLDGWEMDSRSVGEISYSKTGATLGDYSLDFVTRGGYWEIHWFGPPIDLAVYDTFRLDVSTRASEFVSGSWTNLGIIAINSEYGFKGFDATTAIDRNTGETLDGTAWGIWNGDMDRTISYDLSTFDWASVDLMNSYFQVHVAIQNTGAEPGHFYLDNMRFINSREAHTPNPANTSVNVPRDTLLSWLAGSTAVQRDVYWSSDPNAVRDVNQATIGDYPDVVHVNTAELSVDPGALAFSQKLYWRVDEIEAGGTIWQGPVWSFTTGDYIVLDDFQDYNDSSDDTAIWSVWIDGWLPDNEVNPDNGALITTEVWSDGDQSMKLDYDNALAPVSTSSRQWQGDQANWAAEGMTSLSFQLRGYPESQGTVTEDPDGSLVVSGAGSDIWNEEDGCFFAYKTLKAGPGSITAKVGAIEPVAGSDASVNAWAKAGVMMRQALTAGSANQFAAVTGGLGLTNQYRYLEGAITSDGGRQDGVTERPAWLCLVRDENDSITASYAVDNNGQPGSWQAFDIAQLTLSGDIFIGLAISSNDAFVPVQASVTDISFTGTVEGDQWNGQEMGIHQNTPDALYVTLQDGKGASSTVQGDPQGLVNLDWTPQYFDFSDFEGVDFSDVESLLIGLGTPGGSASGAKGIVYIDDVRLHKNP